MANFKDKTTIFTRSGGVKDFFVEDSIDCIINTIFDGQIQMERQRLLDLLNTVTAYLVSFYPYVNTTTPGKTDQTTLLKAIQKHNQKLHECIDILLNQYGYETWQHIKIYKEWGKEETTRYSLENIYDQCHMLNSALPQALESVKNSQVNQQEIIRNKPSMT